MARHTSISRVCAAILSLGVVGNAVAGEKLQGGSPDVIAAFIQSDKTWYQDALVAYQGKDRVGADGPTSKAGFALTAMQYQWNNHQATTPNKPFVGLDPAMPVAKKRVLVDIVCRRASDRSAVTQALKELGVTAQWSGRQATAWAPISRVTTLGNIPGVRYLRPAYRSNSVGLTTSQGDAALRADQARALPPNVKGSGITIGTLSDSFNTNTSASTNAAQDVTSRDLPAGIEVLEDLGSAATDEGRGMMQLIADVAPGSAQKFNTAFNGQPGFAQGIRALADAGCDVIVDDVLFFAEPFFQNGIVAQAVNEVVAQKKAIYFSAAGNNGSASYESAFSPSTAIGVSGGVLHDFDPGPGVDAFQHVTIPVGERVTFICQWDEPFFSVSGAPGSASDLDILLTANNSAQLRVLAGGLASNAGGDPLEIFTFENTGQVDEDGIPGPDTEFNLAFELFSGSAPGLMKVVFVDEGGLVIDEFATNSSTCVGHANAELAIGVAAVAFFDAPGFGRNPARIESFSSLGGAPLLFDDDGTRKPAPLLTNQPRLASIDGGNTTFFGDDLSAQFPNEADTFPNFFGTSAAAPHAAAVAALVLSKAGGPGSLTPAEVETILTQSAVATEGPIELKGAGLINAKAALLQVNSPPELKIRNRSRSGDAQQFLQVSGTAKDDKSIASVRFKVGNGEFKDATGKASWSFKARLKKGLNIILIEVTDSDGSKVSKLINTTR